MTLARPILIIEDDATLRATLVEQITQEGEFVADEAASAAEASIKLAEGEIPVRCNPARYRPA